MEKHQEERGIQEAQDQERENPQDDNEEGEGGVTFQKVGHAVKTAFERVNGEITPGKPPWTAENRNAIPISDGSASERKNETQSPSPSSVQEEHNGESPSADDRTSGQWVRAESQPGADAPNLKAKRKAMKHTKRDNEGREVTDPIQHLPITIKDSSSKDLKNAPKNEPAAASDRAERTRSSRVSRNESEPEAEGQEQRELSQNMHKLFPPPNFNDARRQLMKSFQLATAVSVGIVVSCAALGFAVAQALPLRDLGDHGDRHGQWQSTVVPISITTILLLLCGSLVVWGVGSWLGKRVQEIWDDEVWDADRARESQEMKDRNKIPESTQWLNSLFASVWPLINPDLFISLAGTLEEVMQALLPKPVRMVSVDDLGQGNEALRVLGIRWLPEGGASGLLDGDGNVGRKSSGTGDSAPSRGGGGDVRSEEEADQQDDDKTNPEMAAEEGDFVNMEVAFSYRARSSGKSLRTKSKNAHLFLKFYLLGGIALPVWVEIRGVVGTMRLRLQLMPDPPFFAQATATFSGQPKVDLSCLPLSKHSLNIMDVPLISSFVQSCIDTALAEYVAPRSLTLDLKAMLVGDDFKKDTTAHGVVVVHVKKAVGFKEGDGNLGPLKKGSSDAYVTAGWGKYGKPVASTRIILDEQEPVWEEHAYLTVSNQELNAEEMLRMQIWDSDLTSADDDLGRVEVSLKDLMRRPKSYNRMCEREDRFKGPDGHENMPGTLFWSVGYFAKASITSEQLSVQTHEPDVRSIEDMKRRASESAERKLREASEKGDSREMAQQKEQDYKEQEDRLIIASPPSRQFPSGILSIQLHEITGLGLQHFSKKRSTKNVVSDSDGEGDESDDLPSAYCMFILNHTMVFRTRTKPKNPKPFFNASCERFIRDWRSTELIISVRDSRVHENDPLLGVVYLPLSRMLGKRSQMIETFPLAGGVGYGRARISVVFRSVELQAPKELLGWDYGTLEITHVQAVHMPDDLKNVKAKFSSSIASSKMAPSSNSRDDGGEGDSDSSTGNQTWEPKHHKDAIYIPFKKRYSTPLMIEFYRPGLLGDGTPAFGVFWLKDIPDEEERTVGISLWKGSKKAVKRGRSCAEYGGVDKNEIPVGELDVTMKFWRGLSGYHTQLAQRTREAKLRKVMEVLDCANDNQERKDKGEDQDEPGLDRSAAPDSDTSSSSSTSSSDFDDSDADSDSTSNPRHQHHRSQHDDNSSSKRRGLNRARSKLTDAIGGNDNPEDGKRTPAAKFQEYRHHRTTMHRRHRGLMQWKGVRTVDWMAGKADRGRDRVVGLFRHDGTGQAAEGVQTEA